ncbi:MAG: ABC transporter substrate-binding protein [Clostridia bacterium]|jgi:branched-chain amino acid transport system substrate-binding protein|nr:ABC transporter substrate-binding protein [Clostridia bacterium]
MKKRLLLVLIVVTLTVWSLFIAGCSQSQSKTEAKQKTLDIGALVSLTGWMAPGETPSYEGMQLAVDWINDNGGININGETLKITLVAEDSKSSPEGAMAAATKLVEEKKIKFIAGGVNTQMNIAANTVTSPAGVLRVGQYICLNPDELGPRTPLTFTSISLYQGMKASMQYLKEKYPNVKKVAIIHPADGGNVDRMRYFEPLAKENGLEVVFSGEWAGETVDFTPIVARALATNPDVIAFSDGWPYHLGTMTKVARTLGFKGVIYGSNVTSAEEIVEYSGAEEAEGFFVFGLDTNYPNMPPIIAELVNRGTAKFGKTDSLHLWGWHTVWSLVQGIEAAQSLDPAVVAKKMQAMPIETLWGTGTMGGNKTFGMNNVVNAPTPIFEVRNGKPEFVKFIHLPIE